MPATDGQLDLGFDDNDDNNFDLPFPPFHIAAYVAGEFGFFASQNPGLGYAGFRPDTNQVPILVLPHP